MMISFLTVFLFQGKKKKKKSNIVRLKSKVVERSPMSWVVDDANSSNVFLPSTSSEFVIDKVSENMTLGKGG